MGAYSPAPVVTLRSPRARHARGDAADGARLAAEGTPYVGFLYAGLMIAADGTPKVLEFNCRFGDPETQPILMRLRSDLVAALRRRARRPPRHETGPTGIRAPRVGVVLAAAGYPESVRKGDAIDGLEDAAALPGKVFHAGTAPIGERGRDGRRTRAVRGRPR